MKGILSAVALQLPTLPTGGIHSHANRERLIYAVRRTRSHCRIEITGSLDVEARGRDVPTQGDATRFDPSPGEGA
jgi:hypothetical protein